MTDGFERAVVFVLDHEGEYSNDPHDPGQETRWGISHHAYPLIDLKTLTKDGAVDLYRSDFWVGPGLDRLPPRIAICVFDAGVNTGVLTAIRQLQQELAVAADGVIGELTVQAAQLREERGLLAGYCTRRILRYTTLPTWAEYGKGWTRRVLDVYALALML